jgi:hypothetical protein
LPRLEPFASQKSGRGFSFQVTRRLKASASLFVLRKRVDLSEALWCIGHFPVAFISFGSGSTYLFWLMQKPINPSISRTAPATIIQSGYSIAESKLIRAPYFFVHRNPVAVA